jgi:hypothetical protein
MPQSPAPLSRAALVKLQDVLPVLDQRDSDAPALILTG